jgi:hypothetical protein
MRDPDDPFDRVIARLQANGARIRFRSADSVRSMCPSHPDVRPSLVLTRRDGTVLMKCFAGCRKSAILHALGLQMRDLFASDRLKRGSSAIVETYDYTDRDGTLRAQKVRSEPKRFWWRRPDPTSGTGWRAGLDGEQFVGLYRWAQLHGATLVWVVEGEKAANRLATLGLVATCGPAGAGSWQATDDLRAAVARDATVVVLPDNDRAGERHAERIAADVFKRGRPNGICVKIVTLPMLPPGGDVFDWLAAGHTREELLLLAEAAPLWSPTLAADCRAERRRAQTRARVRRHRDQKRVLTGNGNGNAAKDPEAVARRNAVTRARAAERVRKHRAQRRAAQALTTRGGPCNATEVTRNAVTRREHSSLTLQESLSTFSSDIHSVTREGVTGDTDPRCCGRGDGELRCKLCPESPIYWRISPSTTGPRAATCATLPCASVPVCAFGVEQCVSRRLVSLAVTP